MANILNTSLLFIVSAMAGVTILFSFGYSVPLAALYAIETVGSLLPILLTAYIIIQDARTSKAITKQIAKTKKANAELNDLINRVDEQMNSYTVMYLVRFFMICGVAAFLSLSITAAGILKSLTTSNVYSYNPPFTVRQHFKEGTTLNSKPTFYDHSFLIMKQPRRLNLQLIRHGLISQVTAVVRCKIRRQQTQHR